MNQDTVNQEPLISIIVAVFNGGKTLQRCIDSVAGQTYPHKELIIMDGGSTDGTVDILRANNDKIAYWKSERDRGIYHAWNKALDHVRGDWICFLGSDDYLWNEDVLRRLADQLPDVPSNIRVVYGQVAFVDRHGETICVVGQPWDNVRRQYSEYMSIPHPGTLHHRRLFEERGRFDESFRVAGDYELLLRELKTGDAFFVLDLIVAGWQVGGLSCDPLNKVQILREHARAYQKNSVDFNRLVWLWGYAKAVGHAFLVRLIGLRGVSYVADFYRLVTGRPVFWTRLNK
ncbi:MAG: glycosyltransferase family 2 protein [Bacillota bacterium]